MTQNTTDTLHERFALSNYLNVSYLERVGGNINGVWFMKLKENNRQKREISH
jgi:hypothetical protein